MYSINKSIKKEQQKNCHNIIPFIVLLLFRRCVGADLGMLFMSLIMILSILYYDEELFFILRTLHSKKK